MDANHPRFRTEAPEYDDPPVDILIERIAARWAKIPNIGKREALAILREEFERFLSKNKGSQSAAGDGVQAILAYLDASAAPDITRDALCYAFGFLQKDGQSMESVGRRHGISREAFSKHVIKVQEDFCIHPRSGMRPVAQRKIYQAVHEAKWVHIEQDAPTKQH
jgi:hypothetical protein